MLKRLLEKLKRRKDHFDEELIQSSKSDIKKEVKKEVKKKLDTQSCYLNNLYKEQRKSLIEIQVLCEILEENEGYYSETEINKMFHSIRSL